MSEWKEHDFIFDMLLIQEEVMVHDGILQLLYN